jgi:hypothetical protein
LVGRRIRGLGFDDQRAGRDEKVALLMRMKAGAQTRRGVNDNQQSTPIAASKLRMAKVIMVVASVR